MNTATCWINGSLKPANEATVSVYDHGLLYGDGVFEGIRFYHGHPFRLDDHLRRLFDSARAIQLAIPYSSSQLAEAIEQTIDAFSQPDGYLRLVATRGEGRLGIDPASCPRSNVFVIADELTMVPEQIRRNGIRLIVAATRSLNPDGLDPRIKSLNYLNRILARLEANQAGADEAILLNSQGLVCEGTAENIFVVKDGLLQTPPVSDGALAGITRAAVLQVAQNSPIPYREQSLTTYDLSCADECFLTGTGAELIPVRQIMGTSLPEQRPIFEQLQSGFFHMVQTETRQAA